MNLVKCRGSLRNNFAFSDHSFTRFAAARWQDSMSRDHEQEYCKFLLISHIDLFIFGQCGDNCQ